jgi:hypothetical protein
MKSDYLRNKLGRILLAGSLLAGIGLASGTAVQAQRPWERNQNRNDRSERNRDYRRNRDYNRNDDYRRTDNVYRRNDNVYRRNDNVYRRNDQYNRNGGYGGYGGYGGSTNIQQVAINQGLQDGLYTGSRDAQRGQSYNPQRSHFYKNGHGDNGGYGSVVNSYQYEQAYRNGFVRGYDQGFRRNSGYNNGNSGRRYPW